MLYTFLCQTGSVRLNKVATAYSYQAESGPVRTPATTERFAALLDGRDVTFAGFDQFDDQKDVIGRRVALMYPSQK